MHIIVLLCTYVCINVYVCICMYVCIYISPGNNFLKAAGHHDQTISILAGQMKFMPVIPKNPVTQPWATKKI